ncbi:MAG TPA: DNA-formamidopyrimidine glycosylase family protein [Acidimicrobiales bacterium]
MPELPEMQALSERLDAYAAGRVLTSAKMLSFSSLKTYAPPVEELYGHTLRSVTRRAKYNLFTFDDDRRILLHLSQAGRVDLEEPPKTTKPKGSVVRFVFGGEGAERGILVREFGTQRKASWWVLEKGEEGPLAGLGPEAGSEEFAELIRTSDSNRRLHSDLRDQHVISGIGRGWGDDILHRAHLSPYATLKSLGAEQREALIAATRAVLDEALALERTRTGGLSESSLGGRFKVHNHFGDPCPTPCGDTLRRVSFESYEMTYCPTCQTGGKILADRRLSRLLK